MKVVLLAGGHSVHTLNWANNLSSSGHEVHLFTQHPPLEGYFSSIVVHHFKFLGTLGYFLYAPLIHYKLKAISPDIVNAHYASGYGTLAVLSGIRPLMISVWGSDVYEFPTRSFFHKYWLGYVINRCDVVGSTSLDMAAQLTATIDVFPPVVVTPFGVDIDRFDSNCFLYRKHGGANQITIGTVKSLETQYGIDILLYSFRMLKDKLAPGDGNMKPRVDLKVIGGGSQREALQKLTAKLGLEDSVEFVGPVAPEDVPEELSQLDIFVALSRQESFGVAVLEASAMSRPVITSDVGGLPEVVLHRRSGFVVSGSCVKSASVAMQCLVEDDDLRVRMGKAGRAYVQSKFSWPRCVEAMESAYFSAIRLHLITADRGKSG